MALFPISRHMFVIASQRSSHPSVKLNYASMAAYIVTIRKLQSGRRAKESAQRYPTTGYQEYFVYAVILSGTWKNTSPNL
jgi:hypothetical protein